MRRGVLKSKEKQEIMERKIENESSKEKGKKYCCVYNGRRNHPQMNQQIIYLVRIEKPFLIIK